MREVKYLFVIYFMALLASVVISVVHVIDIERTDELEQKEAKIEALQEENSLLHDDVFNLNQALMKEMEK